MSQQLEDPKRPESFVELFRSMADNVCQVVQGKREVVNLVLLALMAEGHVLLDDAPGVGKTTLGRALASTIDISFGRIQFTPDLLPSDVVGVSIWNRNSSEFQFRPGPLFNGIVLADELNRTSPKTQSALLEAMAERQVTVDGTTRTLGQPFMVIATQNPFEQSGTYSLPESQLDRFLLKLSVGYPDRESEMRILETQSETNRLDLIDHIVDSRLVTTMIRAVRKVHVSPAIRAYLVDISDATRRHPSLRLGASPRATLGLQRIAQARAAADGRNYVIPDDVKAMIPSVYPHRLQSTNAARSSGFTTDSVVAEIMRMVPVGTS